VLTVSYVGTQGHHLMTELDANPGSAAVCFALIAANATPKCGPNGENQVYTLPNGQKVNGTVTAFPFPYYSAHLQWYATIGNSNYNSLQTSVEHKSGDITYLLAYTYAKSIDNGTADGDYINYTNYRLSRSLSAFDMKHNFVGSYNWRFHSTVSSATCLESSRRAGVFLESRVGQPDCPLASVSRRVIFHWWAGLPSICRMPRDRWLFRIRGRRIQRAAMFTF